ncbi:hypothetical protein Glove_232g215 [Diversispora epigaea]|uniref:Tc1-like transposase DDE domain-containing protein n=1 Tax=Diversispora epigaea TaxID=1348612 RepID=A0A397IBI8_9GLOM|nr:hypothetical protein Glove_232g215 [Diversispora epigaea]
MTSTDTQLTTQYKGKILAYIESLNPVQIEKKGDGIQPQYVSLLPNTRRLGILKVYHSQDGHFSLTAMKKNELVTEASKNAKTMRKKELIGVKKIKKNRFIMKCADNYEYGDIRERDMMSTNSPDFNPIENIWKVLKDNIQKQKNFPKNLDEFKNALKEEWSKFDVSILQCRIRLSVKNMPSIDPRDIKFSPLDAT